MEKQGQGWQSHRYSVAGNLEQGRTGGNRSTFTQRRQQTAGPWHSRGLSSRAMARPGDPYASAFVVEPMKCWLIHDRQGQAAHCLETPTRTGRWFSPRGDRWWRVWAARSGDEGARGSLTHIDDYGRGSAADVTGQPLTHRVALARCVVTTQADAVRVLSECPDGLDVVEGPRFAGMQAAKQISSLIPICHPIRLHDLGDRTCASIGSRST